MLSAEPLSFHIGHDGFIWFVGVIEDIVDPLNIGRVKARIIGWHTKTLSTNDLPYCYPIQPITDHTATHNLVNGDWVVGFFLDGKLGQQPMIFGVFPAVAQAVALSTAVTAAEAVTV